MARAKKFGAFGGVFTPSILTLLGVIMYLRLPWIVGQAGLLATLGIIFVAHVISGSTGLSVASIATDKKVETGGTYYIISRSLGLPIGGTLGWALFVGLSFSVSLYLIGFAEVFLEYFGFAVNITTIRIAGSIILLLVTILTFISTSLAIKTQYIILTIMAISLLSVFLGKHDFAPIAPQLHSLPSSLPWITLFAIFFPAVTGFEAGVSMSGDLKDPRKDIPVGTIAAILVGLTVYIGLAVFLSSTVNNTLLVNDTNVLFKISWIPQLVIAGVLGATLSSALGSIMGAPRIMQAVAKDGIAPFFLSKGFGPSNEPRNALLLTFLIAQAGILIGDLNVIARIVTIFFIITYGFLNITYTVESWASSDFRPSFKIPRIVSIIGALACIIVMIELDIIALAIASVVLLGLFFFLKNKELKLHSGDTLSSLWLSLVKTGLLQLAKSRINTRNWRPNVILFSGGSGNRPHLIAIGKALVGKLGIFTNFELIENPDETLLFHETARVSVETFGEHENILTRKHSCRNVYEGMAMISRVYGFAGFEPNTILMGWSKNTTHPEKWEALLHTLHKLDYNLTFLHFDEKKGFGQHKRIDFWWSGKGRNLTLALHLMRFITATPVWRNAEIRILAIHSDPVVRDKIYLVLKQIADNYRIRVTLKVIANPEALPEYELIQAESATTDLAISEIGSMLQHTTRTVIERANTLITHLPTTLFIHASSRFEEINLISETASTHPEPPIAKGDTRKIEPIVQRLQLANHPIVQTTLYPLAELLEKQTYAFIENALQTLQKGSEAYLGQLETLANETLTKLLHTQNLQNPQEKHWAHVTILNDYYLLVQNLLNRYKDSLLPLQQETLRLSMDQYLSETDHAVKNLPETITLQYTPDDFKAWKSITLFGRFRRALTLRWARIFGHPIRRKIRLQPAAGYFLYYKRLEAGKRYYNRYASEQLSAFAGIKTILTLQERAIEKWMTGSWGEEALRSHMESTRQQISLLQTASLDYLFTEGQAWLDQLAGNLENLSLILAHPYANSQSRKFSGFLTRKKEKLENALAEFPEEWSHYMAGRVTSSHLDYQFLLLKNRLDAKIEKTLQDLEQIIALHIEDPLQAFEDRLARMQESTTRWEQNEIFSHQAIAIPQLDERFNLLYKEISEAVGLLPEKMEMPGEALQEKSWFERLEHIDTCVVEVRNPADFYISNRLNEQIRKQSVAMMQQLTLSVATLKNLIRMANFHFENRESSHQDDTPLQQRMQQQRDLLDSIFQHIEKERIAIKSMMHELRNHCSLGLKDAFSPLHATAISTTSYSLKIELGTTQKRRLFVLLAQIKSAFNQKISNQVVTLLYRQSQGLLWANRLEQAHTKATLFPGEPIRRMVDRISPKKNILLQLPFYYANLFTGSPSLGENFWVGMEEEIAQGSKAIDRYMQGATGLLMITGERSSGKSSLSKYLARRHFEKPNIFHVPAPRECTANATLFEQTLLKVLGRGNSLPYSMEMLPAKSTIVVNDLELWWEQKPSGTQVVERIVGLMQQYGHKVLFIINVNQYALKIINQLSEINTRALDLVICQPFDAQELQELLLVRHRAGGMTFLLEKKREEAMTNLDYARLFNRLFHLSGGNPGQAINLWLAGIQELSGTTLIMRKPASNAVSFSEPFSQEEIYYILQFILHRRFSISRLSAMLQTHTAETEARIRALVQKGILTEKFPEIYCLNPALEIHLVKKLKSLELL